MNNQPLSVPLCDLGAQYREIQADVEEAVLQVLRSGQAILGPEVAALEAEVADYCGAKYGIGCASGTDALLLALHALEIGPGDEVILPPFTFFATAGSILRTGATPVFADIDPITFNIDARQVAARVTSRTKAIMPVHLYGQCADMDSIWKIAEEHNLVVIEDAAQAIGADYRGKKTGTLGGIACFSFYPSKNLGTYGDAGLVTTDNALWSARMKALRVHGMEPKYYHKYLGWNARIDAVHAAILRVKLPHLEDWTVQRQAAAGRYDDLIQASRLHRFMQRPAVMDECRHVFNQYVVRVPAHERDAMMQHLKQNGVACEIYYPVPLHLQECLRHLDYRPGDFPISEEASRSVIALPMFPEITSQQQQRVIEVCAAYRVKQTRVAA
jgi:dTDP-4-amino-4,6-dideoxygalactose transaminase